MARRGWVDETTQKNSSFAKTVKKGLISTDTSLDELVKTLGVSRVTYYNDLKAPGKIPLDRLRLYCRKLKLPDDEILQFI